MHSLCHNWNYCDRVHHFAFICIFLVSGCDRENNKWFCLTKILRWKKYLALGAKSLLFWGGCLVGFFCVGAKGHVLQQ